MIIRIQGVFFKSFASSEFNLLRGFLEEKGNTEICAEFIQNAIGGDFFEIETIDEYSKDYHKCTEEAKQELRENARPELKHYLSNIADYDNIFICGPCW